MKRLGTNTVIAVLMVLLSVSFFTIQILIFHDSRETAYLLFQDLAFLPINVLLVTWVLDRILRNREKQERLEQSYIIICAFFSEIGINMILELNPYIKNLAQFKKNLEIKASWTEVTFKSAANQVKSTKIHVEIREEDLKRLTKTLLSTKAYLVQMFNNPNLLEHDQFTDMLWAAYHLIDELQSRESSTNLPEEDIRHVQLDIERAYGFLIIEWIFYMRHLKNSFPYLFSLAVRKNPFNEDASIIIRN